MILRVSHLFKKKKKDFSTQSISEYLSGSSGAEAQPSLCSQMQQALLRS